ncbi:MAG: hypothetical protein FJ087_08905 [Deltaproteobacteria bacterium]|nr:hypothetical protein [Deltaproteobacteria bacterium]
MGRVRSRHWVEVGFQLKYTALIVGVAVALVAVLGTLYLRTRAEQTRLMGVNRLCLGVGTAGDAIDREFDAELSSRLEESDLRVTLGLVAAAVVLVAALAFVGIRLTFHVVGPARAVSGMLWNMSEGHFVPIRKLRKGDEFGFLEDDLRTLQESLAREALADAALMQDAADAVGAARGAGDPLADRLAAAAAGKRARAGHPDAGGAAATPADPWFR